MCEYCGCREVAPIAELMDEHLRLMELAGDVRRCLSAGDRDTAVAHLKVLAGYLDRHVRREEAGVFTALRDQGEFLEEVDLLEKEHQTFDEQVETLDPGSESFESDVARLLRELDDHVERENLGIFPVSVVTLGATGWDTVNRAHDSSPSFLRDGAEPATDG
jgi:hemerythrin-like domain-containing protein